MIDINRLVSNFVVKYGTANPYTLASYLKIRIITTDLPENLRGFLVRVLRRKIIILNDQLSEIGAKVVLCHELGHVRLHSGYGYHFHPNQTYYIPAKREREASEYGARLLSYSHDLDGNLMSKIINEKKPDPKIIHRLLAELIEAR